MYSRFPLKGQEIKVIIYNHAKSFEQGRAKCKVFKKLIGKEINEYISVRFELHMQNLFSHTRLQIFLVTILKLLFPYLNSFLSYLSSRKSTISEDLKFPMKSSICYVYRMYDLCALI